MKELQQSGDVLPVEELIAHASTVLSRLKKAQRPFFITQNGKPAAVLLSPQDFDHLSEQAHFVEVIDEGAVKSETDPFDENEITRQFERALNRLKD